MRKRRFCQNLTARSVESGGRFWQRGWCFVRSGTGTKFSQGKAEDAGGLTPLEDDCAAMWKFSLKPPFDFWLDEAPGLWGFPIQNGNPMLNSAE